MVEARTGFELRDHTADIALFVWGDTMEALFRTAAEGFYAVVGELCPGGAAEAESIRITATDVDALLHDFLAELLFKLETSGVMLSNFVFDRLDDTVLHATATGARLDTDMSTLDREVKAVTFHDLNIVKHDRRCEVTIVLDI